MMSTRNLILTSALIALAAGCTPMPEPAQLSGMVTFKGEPVPAGWISFTPDVAAGNDGPVKVLQINNGAYDSSKGSEPGLKPGPYFIKIAGFDGVRIPLYGQGKQIFNPVDETFTVPAGSSTKDFEIPESAGQNVKIQPTADT
jgi:hypothetical protein